MDTASNHKSNQENIVNPLRFGSAGGELRTDNDQLNDTIDGRNRVDSRMHSDYDGRLASEYEWVNEGKMWKKLIDKNYD